MINLKPSALQLVATLLLSSAASAEMGPFLLPLDALHHGAMLDRIVGLHFYRSGELLSGYLKSEYSPRPSLKFAAQSLVH
jgi:hypothetical protein